MQLKSPAYEKTAATGNYVGWLVYGPDQGRSNSLAVSLYQRYAKTGLDKVSFDSGQIVKNPGLLSDHVNGASLFSPGSAVRIRDADDKLVKVIEPILDAGIGETRLIIEAGELTAASKLKKLFEGRADAAAMACWQPSAAELAQRAQEGLKAAGVVFEPGVPALMARLSPGDSGAILRECEKIAVYASGRKVTLTDVEAVCADNSESGFSDVTTSLGDRDIKAAMVNFHKLIRGGESAIGILRVAQRYLQRLHAARIQMEAGKNAEQAMASLRPPVFFKEKPAVTRQLGRWTVKDLEPAITRLIEAERLSKLGYPEDAIIGQAMLDIMLKGQQPAAAK